MFSGVKFYGVPMFLEDCTTERQSRNYAKIPSNTDVLITHSPAYGILDFDDNINYYGHENEASNGENVDLLGKLLI